MATVAASYVELWFDRWQGPAEVDRRVALEYVVDDRAFRLAGELERGKFGHWRLWPVARPVLLLRRSHMRSTVDVIMVLSSETGSVRRLGRTRNLSIGGALGEFRDVPHVGERLRFALVPRVGTDVIKGTCRVTRAEDDGGVAVAFESLTMEELGRLSDFILRHR